MSLNMLKSWSQSIYFYINSVPTISMIIVVLRKVFAIMLGSSLLYPALTLLILSIYYAYTYFRKRFQYWKKRNVPFIKPVPILGNFSEYILFKKYLGHVVQDLCQKLPNAPVFGAFYGTEPALVVQDPEIIKLIMTKDYNFFSGRETLKYNNREMLAKNLFFSYGDKAKVFRKNFSPLFSTAKMKNMYHLIAKHSQIFEEILDQETKTSDVIEVKALMTRYTMDCICSCAFGVEPQVLVKKDENPFKEAGDTTFDTKHVRAIKNTLRSIWPAVFYGFGLQVFPKKLETFFHSLMTGVFKERQYKATNRNDFVDLLLKLKEEKKLSPEKFDGLEINDDVLVAQLFLFFGAGFDTSAITSSYTLYELAKSPQAQEKVLEEVDSYLRHHDNVLEYECVTEMPYLEACIDEALRLYPVLATLTREVTENYTLPNGLELEKGLRIHIPLYHLQHSPEHFPEPEQYRPERFLGEEKRMIKPYTYMPFGEGPRICIGLRFAKMQMISGLVTLLKKYRVELAQGMERQIEFEPKAFITYPVSGIRLKFIKRKGWENRIFQSSLSNVST